ncbi:metallophosphoesterase [Sphingobacterium sp. Mn56C]|uniref:metallophosphoesterase n=1 Tax=Sphingobacterium sp. Mn56C TaxID=3395261 RepID=UPI003BC8D83B
MMDYSAVKRAFDRPIKYRSSIRTKRMLGLGLVWALLGIAPTFGQEHLGLSAQDGPYVLYADGAAKIIRVQDGTIVTSSMGTNPLTVVTDDGKHRFSVPLHRIKTPKWNHKVRGDIAVLSDPHGDFDSFYAILRDQQIIDADYGWTFGKNHLLLIGDVFDRGRDVLPIFWLLYKLEAEAERAGGSVHFLLGNHEEMVLRENLKYNEPKYIALKDSLGIAYRELWSMQSELGRWLQSRNTIEKIGDRLFVHAGLSVDMVKDKWTIPAVNDSVRHYLYKTKGERDQSAAAKFLFGANGPLWYRGMVRQEERYNPLPEGDLRLVLDFYKVKEIYVGHTIFPEVSFFYGNTVRAVNVNNRVNREQGRSRGLLLRKKEILLLYDAPIKNKPL